MARSDRKAKESLPAEAMAHIGTSGLKYSGNAVRQEWSRQLQGVKGREFFRMMRDDSAIVGGFFAHLRAILRRATYRVEKGSADDAGATDAVLRCEQCLDNLDFTLGDLFGEAGDSAGTYGFAPHEIVYDVDDGGLCWSDFPPRSPLTVEGWRRDDDNCVIAMEQLDPGSGRGRVIIPMEKMVNFRGERALGNPEGRSVLRNARRPWHYASNLEEIEAIKGEKDATGTLLVQMPQDFLAAPDGSTEAAIRDSVKKQAGLYRTDENMYLLFPSFMDTTNMPTGWGVDLMSVDGAHFPYDTAIRRHESRMLISVGAEFILMGIDNSSSRAASGSRTSRFALGVESFLSAIVDCFNRQAINRLFAIDGRWRRDQWPHVAFDPLDPVDLEALGNFLKNAGQGGFIAGDEVLEDSLRSTAGLPSADQDSRYDDPGTTVPDPDAVDE